MNRIPRNNGIHQTWNLKELNSVHMAAKNTMEWNPKFQTKRIKLLFYFLLLFYFRLAVNIMQINKMLKPEMWQTTFDSDGKVFGFQKALKLIILGVSFYFFFFLPFSSIMWDNYYNKYTILFYFQIFRHSIELP